MLFTFTCFNALVNRIKQPGVPGGGGVLPYMGYISMCGPKGYGILAILVINRVLNLTNSGHK